MRVDFAVGALALFPAVWVAGGAFVVGALALLLALAVGAIAVCALAIAISTRAIGTFGALAESRKDHAIGIFALAGIPHVP